MMNNTRFYLLILTACLIIAGCAHEAGKPATVAAAPQKPALMEPFRFHKLIEVSPGNDFDVLSWGRGSSAVGSFAILHSDSTNMKYTTTTGDMDGSIVDVYNSDMDLDGNPEILIQTKATDTTNYAVIYAFEFNNDKAQKLDFPKLTKSQKAGYRGNDNFYIQDGKFMREFPVYDGNGKDAKPTGQKRLLQYGLRDNEFTVQQINTDTTSKPATPQAQQVKVTPAKTHTSSTNTQTTSSKKKKKKKHNHEEQTSSHNKKKKHHRHSED